MLTLLDTRLLSYNLLCSVSIAVVGKVVDEASMTAFQHRLVSQALNRLSREGIQYLDQKKFCGLFQNVDMSLPLPWSARHSG